MTARTVARDAVLHLRHRVNLRRVESCGPGTLIAGEIWPHPSGGSIRMGSGSYIRARIIMRTREANLTIGDNCFVNAGTVIEVFDSISLGHDLLMGPGATIVDGSSHSTSWAERAGDLDLWRRTGEINLAHLQTKPVVVEDGVWIGSRALVFPGVTLGEGSTVGAAAVVTRSVPPFTVWAGNPARQVNTVEAVRPASRPGTAEVR